MSKGLKTALKQLDNAANNLGIESQDRSQYTDERSLVMLAQAQRLLLTIRNGLEGGRAYADLLVSQAQELAHTLKTES